MSYRDRIILDELADYIKRSKEGLEYDKIALDVDEMDEQTADKLRGAIAQRANMIQSLERIMNKGL